MIAYNLLITAIIFVLFLIFLWNLYILRKKKYDKLSDKDLPFISVLVPARNEEHNINSILTSLLQQDYPRYELIVLNDNSEDNTGLIINKLKKDHPELKVIGGKPLEEGWTGKCYACKQLYDASKGEYILFTDADTKHYPNSLRDAVTIAVKKNADMLSLFPSFTMITFAEKLLMPMLIFTIMMLLPFYFVDKKGFVNFSVGIGPFMLFRRKAYSDIGTHESVKSALVEDVWLARKIKEYGLKLVIADGTNILSVRMYRGFKDIWEGFSKNIFAGLKFSTPALITVNTVYILLFFVPFILLTVELYLHLLSPNSGMYSHLGINNALFFTGIQVCLLYIARFLLSVKFNLGVLSSILHPAGAIMVPIIGINSWIWIKLRKGAKWKGRIYAKDIL